MNIPFEPQYLKVSLSSDIFEAFKKVDEYNEDNLKKYLGIDYDFEKFKAYVLVQAFLYRKNDERVDEENKTMKIIDIGNVEAADEKVRDYVRGVYKADYEKRLYEQNGKEMEILEDELAEIMTTCDDLEKFKYYFKNGLSRGNTIVKIENTLSPAAAKLIKSITNPLDKDYSSIPLICEKIYIIIFGRDREDQVIWNNGNAFRRDGKLLKKIVCSIDYNLWNEIHVIYKSRNIHIYRDGMCNRHGHSNDLPSYWALGYKTLAEMFSSVSQEEIDEYKSKHIGCCGL